MLNFAINNGAVDRRYEAIAKNQHTTIPLKRQYPKMDLIGQRYGRLVVVEELPIHQGGKTYRKFKCLCDCGNYTEVFMSNLRSGYTKSCGCLLKDVLKETARKPLYNGRKYKTEDLIGQLFGRLTVLQEAPPQNIPKW